ncbi:MAG: FecR domain-containing protein [Bacteroidota bacterium]
MDEQFEHSVDYELLGRYFAGEATEEERTEAEQWIAASDANQMTFAALTQIWEEASDPAAEPPVDVDRAWQSVAARTPTEELGPRRGPWLRLAAAVVVAVGLGLLAWRYLGGPGTPGMQTWAAGETPRTDTLPDGSVVTLNAGARLEFPGRFAAAERTVTLSGEAFFAVAHNPQKPFVVRAGYARVRVLGTSFSVRSAPEKVAVVVATGKVKLSAPDKAPGQAVVLEPGQRGDFDRQQARVEKTENIDANYLYWKDHRLVFRDSPLREVAAELEEVFGAQVQLRGDAIGNCPLSTTFEDLSIESILKIIAETFNLEVTQDANIYTLQGEGC